MNWNYWLPWRDYPQDDTEDSEQEGQVIEGDGPKRVIVSEERYDEEPDYGVID